MSKKAYKSTSKLARNIVPVLGIAIDSTQKGEVLRAVTAQLDSSSSKQDNAKPMLIFTPNPEIVLQAQKDRRLAEIINSADLSVPDGQGLVWAIRYLQGARLEAVPGRVLFSDLVAQAAKRGWRMFLLGGRKGVAERAAKALARSYQLPVTSYQFDSGPWLDNGGEPVDKMQRRVEQKVIEKINKFRPHLLFVAFGPPKQEKWLARNLPRLRVKAAMTVGGTLDYFAGKTPFPPRAFENLGLEWLWRLITQPWRAPRIFQAVIVFPLKVIFEGKRKRRNS